MAANKGVAAGDRPPWLPDGMDADSSYNVEIRIIARNTRARWFCLNKVIDADVTNFVDLVADVEDKYPGNYGDLVRVFYFCIERRINIQLCTDQDLLAMFAKHKDSKCCYLTFAYHSSRSEPFEIPPWDFSSSWQSVEIPLTPCIPCPRNAQPSQTQSHPSDENYLANPNPSFENIGLDEEGLYLHRGSQQHNQPPPPHPTEPQSQGDNKGMDGESGESESDDESDDDDDEYDLEDVDEIIKDSEPNHVEYAEYDKKDPPMTVGSVYRDMHSFKMALASHAVYHEKHYDIEKSDTGRYRVFCSAVDEGCKWRLLENHVDDCYSVAKFKAAYQDVIPSIPDKTMWPEATHGFFMHPPLLKSTVGRRRNRFKGALEGGSRKKSKRHECPICHELGHHWYTCKNRCPEDIAAMQAEKGLPKKRQKKAVAANTEISIVLAPQQMVFPTNEVVEKVVHKKRKKKSSSSSISKTKAVPPSSTSHSANTPFSNRSATGSNEPVPLQIVHRLLYTPLHQVPFKAVEEVLAQPSTATTFRTPKKRAVMKKLTPTKAVQNPSSPAANTRSKMKLNLD